MKERARLVWGAEAGLLAGIVVALFFFVGDLVHLAPLSTPTALGRTFMGPGNVQMSGSFPDGAVAAVAFGANLVAFTLLHLLTFTALGVAAVVLFNAAGWPLNLATGALYGAVAGSAVLYVSASAASATGVAAGLPGFGGVLAANLLAGAVIGGGVQLMRTAPEDGGD